ncbi:hypothetical protein BH10ACT9_BH10ACT9_03600 [soil metagenome]
MTQYLAPALDDPISLPFWKALSQSVFMLQQCTTCGYVRFPAAERCPECWSPGGMWQEVNPVGTIWSHTTYHRALHPALADAVPYRVVLVELDGGPLLPGRLLGDEAPITGNRVHGVFTTVSADFTMLDWMAT